MIKVLLVEDDEACAYTTMGGLELIGQYEVTRAKNGEEAWTIYQETLPDIVVTDVEMPLMNGYELTRRIRKVNPEIIIIMESGKTSPKSAIDGFALGVDDYIKKPFVAEELHARIQAILKRTHRKGPVPNNSPRTAFHIGKYSFDPEKETLHLQTETRKLTSREAEILSLLLQHKNTLVSREKILKRLWGSTDLFHSRSLDVFISKLRKYLSQDPSVKITNVKGKGLMLEEEEMF